MTALQIGILAEKSSRIFDWVATHSVLRNSNAELTYFVECPQNHLRRNWRAVPGKAAWRVLEKIEARRFGKMDVYAPPEGAVSLECEFKGHFKVFAKSEIDKIQNAKIDLIIRLGGRGIYKGDILSCARLGLISIHHGNNRAFRGGPPGFWEILEGAKTVGYVVQRLTEKLDGGEILARGELPTSRFAIQNRTRLFEAADNSLAQVIGHALKYGKLPDPEPKSEVLGKIYFMPRLPDIFRYLKISRLSGANDAGDS
ncbi:Methionyl-tRNA formyltransferase [Roseibium album]|nr:Methionyl-tRNA formyltransferase [Roseibium album]